MYVVYCVIACTVYHKQSILCDSSYTLLMVYVHRVIFTIGIALLKVTNTSDNTIVSANSLGNYSYVSSSDAPNQIARCVTGLGPNTINSSSLGGVYFNGSRLSFETCTDKSSYLIYSRAENPGVINIQQCREFSTSVEGIYTCTMMNSSMMNESIRFGVYFTGRSK